MKDTGPVRPEVMALARTLAVFVELARRFAIATACDADYATRHPECRAQALIVRTAAGELVMIP